jgi:hypothetical protein
MLTLNAINPERQRKAAAWLICAAALLVVAAVIIKEVQFLNASPAAGEERIDLPAFWPQEEALLNLKAMDKITVFDRASLSDKINGKAELYLAAGFKRMLSCRYQIQDKPDLWFEVLLFEQDTPDAAFSVFSQQRRRNAEPLSFVANGYRAQNAIYAQWGSFYLEISASAVNPELNAAMEAWSRQACAQARLATKTEPVDLLISQGAKADGIVLLASDAFGLQDFGQVWLGECEVDGAVYLLFLRPFANAGEAENWQQRIEDFWRLQGAEQLAGHAYELEGMYQIAAVQDNYLLGIHEAPNLNQGLRILQNLAAHIQRPDRTGNE